ncbi:hypothetical protein FSP39_004150 [Pinctada imbricata]|uniref:Uncharacterized protein n=1 Tax=Pinctada imbricata TaxID=66713 RepID=A0AA88XYW2_PINIB|nr:hypothetical protein FSP39_004150 [Pinctada imbricata]
MTSLVHEQSIRCPPELAFKFSTADNNQPPPGYGQPPPPAGYVPPQPGYGQPPPPGYGYGYGPPPPMQQQQQQQQQTTVVNQPPPPAYAQPPPPAGYGQPPPPAGYAPQPGYGPPPPQGYGYGPPQQQQQQQQQTTVVVAGQPQTTVIHHKERFADKTCLNLILVILFWPWIFIWIALVRKKTIFHKNQIVRDDRPMNFDGLFVSGLRKRHIYKFLFFTI